MSVPRIAFPIRASAVGRVEKHFISLVSNLFPGVRYKLRPIFLNDNNELSPQNDRHVISNIARTYKYDLVADRKIVSY
ncbi:MAG: hypothetical protein WDO71_23895 [Bacteroidota bacterium]